MHVIRARNVHEALPMGLQYLTDRGIERASRNGPVLQAPEPVTTVYNRPWERVIFWPERDANPFFHLYEALWMLDGRNQVEPLVRYAKNMANYADDGVMHGAYGHRWRKHFHRVYLGVREDIDQLEIIARRLKGNPTDRQCVLQMWDARADLNQVKGDLPCNTIATVQVNNEGKLDLAVFCRSNDIIWGAYGANAVHFSMLHEYLAFVIGVEVGRYHQISVNYHAYREVYDPLVKKLEKAEPIQPYVAGVVGHDVPVRSVPMLHVGHGYSMAALDRIIRALLMAADTNFEVTDAHHFADEWSNSIFTVLRSFHIWKSAPKESRRTQALDALLSTDPTIDWVVAARQWFERRP